MSTAAERLMVAEQGVSKASKALADAEAALVAEEGRLDRGTGKPDLVVRATVVRDSARRVLAAREEELTAARAEVAKERRAEQSAELSLLRQKLARWRDTTAPAIGDVVRLYGEIADRLLAIGIAAAESEDDYTQALALANALGERTDDIPRPSLLEARRDLQIALSIDRERRGVLDQSTWLASVDVHDWRTAQSDAESIAKNEATARRNREQEALDAAHRAGVIAGAKMAQQTQQSKEGEQNA